ncbi:MAG: magnesium-translocating P-type ATPase [Actinomycetes bacterium]
MSEEAGVTVTSSVAGAVPGPPALTAVSAASMEGQEVLAALGTAPTGLSAAEAARRFSAIGPNAVRSHGTQWVTVLARQLRSPLLVLLAVTAAASFALGERADAVIIAVILSASVALGFVNEFRAEVTAASLHSQLRHTSIAWRDGQPTDVDVIDLVPGDVVELQLGQLVPADLRLLEADGLACEESTLTGESMPAEKSTAQVPAGTPLAELGCAALMGTVVHAGAGRGVVVATGARAEFGRIAAALGTTHPETEFQVGLRRVSMLLVRVAAVLTAAIFAINIILDRPPLDALLFSLAIAVGISPQLLPAVVSTSLAAGSRQLARDKVLVKRLVCIEDLGDVDVLFTDKTGTLTDGRLRFMRSVDSTGVVGDAPLMFGLLCTDRAAEDGGPVAGNPLDQALWDSPATTRVRPEVAGYRRLATLPFDHERRIVSVLVEDAEGATFVVTKCAPETVLARCVDVPAPARSALDAEFAAGNRVVAVASRRAPSARSLGADDEQGLHLRGLLVFLDPPKPSARQALARLSGLGVTVKVLTGDNPTVAATVCAELGLPSGRVLSGPDVDALDDARLCDVLAGTTIFARVSPEQKARIVRAQRRAGAGVAFLGDGVNDAIALHAADVGISVDTATDVAKDAADVILLEKDLGVLAAGVVGGRRIFANTLKYVLMGTSSNFGNMFSAAGASAFLRFLPMLPSQILLNNLLYDSSQLAIPTDHVDQEQLARPSRWDVGFIRHFMLVFGPVSSLFDFATFAVMLRTFHAGPALFHTGWFVESLATQTLVIFAIRTRRVPFLRSRASLPLTAAALAVVTFGAVLPVTPLADDLGFVPLPATFFVALVVMVVAYLVLIELVKGWFFRARPVVHVPRRRTRVQRVHRRAARFSTGGPLPEAPAPPRTG